MEAHRRPVICARVRYWSEPRAQWASHLRKLHAQGFTLVESFVPWRIHETAVGEFDWADHHDLRAFLDAAQAADLRVVLRLGPRADVEVPAFGFPDHVLADPAVQARTARGTPAWLPLPPRAFPIPSYAASAFHAHVRRFFTEVARVVADHPAVAGLADEDDAFTPHFGRGGAYDLDYHPDAIAWWRDSTGLDGDPPRAWDPADRARSITWVRAHERYVTHARAVFDKLLVEVGLGNVPRVAARSVTLGVVPWYPPFGITHAPREQLLRQLAHGERGVVLDGDVLDAAWVHPLLGALTEIGWTELRRVPAIALVDVRADQRFGLATSAAPTLPPILGELLPVGPGGAAELGSDSDAILARRWLAALATALDLAQVPYAIVSEDTSEEQLAQHRAVIAPTLARIDRGLWQRLRALAEHKRAIVVIGPTTPTHDELGQPLPHDAPPKRIGKIREGSLEDLPGLAEDLAGLAGTIDAWQTETAGVRCYAHADASGVRAVILVSDLARPAQATLLVDERTQTLSDPLSKDALRVTGGRATIAMPANGARLFVVR